MHVNMQMPSKLQYTSPHHASTALIRCFQAAIDAMTRVLENEMTDPKGRVGTAWLIMKAGIGRPEFRWH